MQNINTLLTNTKPGEISEGRHRKVFDQETIDATQYFFAKLKLVYGSSKFDAYWPTDTDVRLVKREWAESIGKLTRDEIDMAIENAKKQMHDPDWSWPNIGLILSGARRHLNASHRAFLPAPDHRPLVGYEAAQRAAQLRSLL